MPAITLKNIPEALLLRLRQQAKANGRSLNSEILFQLGQSGNQENLQAILEDIRSQLAMLTDASKAGR